MTVDGVSYEYLGVGFQALPGLSRLLPAVPESVSYDSHYTNFTFTAGPVNITASFFLPVTLKDYCRTSIPLSYLTTTVESTDGQAHGVRFYSDVDASWVSWGTDKTMLLELHGPPAAGTSHNTTASPTRSEVYSRIVGQAVPDVFGEDHDFAQWGNLSYTTSPMGARNFSFLVGSDADVRSRYLEAVSLGNIAETDRRGLAGNETVFAYSHDMGTVLRASVTYSIGTIQTPAMEYRTGVGPPLLVGKVLWGYVLDDRLPLE